MTEEERAAFQRLTKLVEASYPAGEESHRSIADWHAIAILAIVYHRAVRQFQAHVNMDPILSSLDPAAYRTKIDSLNDLMLARRNELFREIEDQAAKLKLPIDK